jgi:hypothetical protein
VKHCRSGQLQFFTTLTLDSNGTWIGNDLNKSHRAHFYWLLADLTVVNLAIHMPHVSLICNNNNTSATVEGLADSDSSGPLPTSVCVLCNISPVGYKELVEKTN